MSAIKQLLTCYLRKRNYAKTFDDNSSSDFFAATYVGESYRGLRSTFCEGKKHFAVVDLGYLAVEATAVNHISE